MIRPAPGKMVLAGVTPPESGVVRRDEAAAPPPWEIVQAYLARGEHRAWVEGHAQRSRAFAEVLEALRSDQEEDEAGEGVVVQLRRPPGEPGSGL